MFLTLLAALIAGLGAAGIGIAIYKLSKKKVGKWIIPTFAGLGILGYQISYEYSWYEAQLEHQPKDTVIVATDSTAVFFRPWTFVFPLIDSYTLIEPKKIIYSEQKAPKAQLASFILYRVDKSIQDALTHKKHVLNCTTAELIQLKEDNQIDSKTKIKKLGKEDKLFKVVCQTQPA